MLNRNVIAITAIAAAVAIAPAPAGAIDEYDGDTVIVKYRQGVGPAERQPLRDRTGVGPTIDRVEVVDAQVARVDGDPAAVAALLEGSPKVAYAEPDFAVTTAGAVPDDRRFDSQYALRNTGQRGGTLDADIDAPAGWDRLGLDAFPTVGGARIGIVDTGIDATHPDLQGRVQACHSFRPSGEAATCADDFGHGSHVSGIVGAATDNGEGIAGVAFNSPLIVCRALGGPDGTGTSSDVADCIGWVAARGAGVINMSFEGGPSETIRRAVRRAWDGGGRDGAMLVAAAGNGGLYTAEYPASFPPVISVAATNRHDAAASFSDRHEDVELAAPGAGIVSTELGGGYEARSGTSMAVPHVTGVAAHLRALHPGASAARIRRLLQRSAQDLGAGGRDSRFGYGRVSLGRAVAE